MSKQGRIYIEFVTVGNVVKVSAICDRTGREVCIVGDPKASKASLERIVINKLRRVMAREAEAGARRPKGLVI